MLVKLCAWRSRTRLWKTLSELQSLCSLSGTVKWFDDIKGYGFILCDDNREIFVHYSEIAGSGYRSLYDGEHVKFVIKETERGPQATNVEVQEEVNAPRKAQVASPRESYEPPVIKQKVRVYELAQAFGVESKAVMDQLKEMGEFVRSASSTIEAPVVRRLKEAFSASNTNNRP